MRIYLDKQYGLNGDTIKFVPYCKDKVEKGHYIEHGDYILACIDENKFTLVTNNPNDFIFGSDLLNNEWKIKRLDESKINRDPSVFVKGKINII